MLLVALRQKPIPAVRPQLENLFAAGLQMSPGVIDAILEESGESRYSATPVQWQPVDFLSSAAGISDTVRKATLRPIKGYQCFNSAPQLT